MAKKKKDVLLDHNYDGIQELDNDLPPWWLWLFYLSIAFAVVYMFYYHFIGIGPSSAEEYMMEMNPNYVAEGSVAGGGIFNGYKSPYYSPKGEMTPRVLEQMKKYIGPEITGNELVMEAMRRSDEATREKLKETFPELWEQLTAGGAALTKAPAAQPKAEATAEPVANIEPLTDEASLAAGKNIFVTNCSSCHGKLGEGGIGPNLTDDYWIHGAGMGNVVKVITNGVPAKGMITWKGILTEDQIKQVASYILTLHGSNPPNAKAPQGEKAEYPL